MAIYYMLFIWLLACSLFFYKIPERQRKALEFLCAVIPTTLIAALRDTSIGTDTASYVYATIDLKNLGYAQFKAKGIYSNFEPGFMLLMQICAFFKDPAHALIIISSLIITFIPFVVIYLICERPSMVYCVYYLTTQYFMSLTAMRQCLSIAFIFLAIYALYKTGNSWLAVGIVLVAACFHTTALITIPIFALSKVKPSVKVTTIILAVSAALIVLAGNLLPVIFSLIPKYRGYVTSAAGAEFLKPGRVMPPLQVAFFGILLVHFLSGDGRFTSTYEKRLTGRVSTCAFSHGQTAQHRSQDSDGRIACDQVYLLKNMAVYGSCSGILVGVTVLFVNVFYRFMYEGLPFITIIMPAAIMYTRETRISRITRVLCTVALVLFFIAFLFVPQKWFGISPYRLYYPHLISNYHPTY